LLQEPGGSSSLSRELLDEEVEEIIKAARSAGEKIESFIGSDDPVILYGGRGQAGAAVLKAFLQGLSWGKIPKMVSATDFLYGTLPYMDEKIKAVFYMGSARERNLAVSLISGLEIMNSDFLIVTPIPDDPVLKSRAGEEAFASVSGSPNPILSEIIASAFAGIGVAKKVEKRDDMRISRLESELNSIKDVYSQLILERCQDIGEFLRQNDKIDVVFTPFLTSAALLFFYRLIDSGKSSRYFENDAALSLVEYLNPSIVLYTSVEEASLREFVFRMQKEKKVAKLLRFNTDPLSALIYASFFSRCISQ